jgi:outer membrane protein insertion porin family
LVAQYSITFPSVFPPIARSLNAFVVLVLSLLISVSAFGYQDLGPRRNLFKMDGVEVEGLKKVERQAILEKVGSRAGMMLDNYLLRKDIEKIYSLKYFESVEAHKKKKNGKTFLTFVVKEKPIITKIIFQGNDEIDEDDLKATIKTKAFAILDVNTIQNDLEALQKQYEEKGFYLAKVKYELKKINDENVELVYKFKEYDKVLVKKVTYLGNKAFTDEELKGIMETREEGLFSFMSGSGNFKEFNFQTDIERVKYFYKTKGYLQVNVGTPEITVSEDKKWVFITMKINEGPQFSINNIYFQGEVLFPEGELKEKISLKTEAVYSEELLRLDIQKLTELYQDEGYAFANVLRTLQVVPGENKVDIEFSFEKGKIAYFGKISVKGNTKTRDKVVRRELFIREGMKFSGSALRKSKEAVNRLGFFEPNSVLFNTVSPKGRDDILDVDIQVKERNTGQISLGAGYSTATGGFLQASIAQNNFRGLGQNLSFSLSLSGVQKTFNLGFTEPYLLDSRWTAGGDVFKTENANSDNFTFEREGFNLRVGYPIFEFTRLFATYKYEDTTISNADDPTINEEIENGVASSIRFSLIRDMRDNAFEPSKGYFLSVAAEYTGLGWEKKWLKNEFDARYYKKVYGDLVFRSRLFSSNLMKISQRQIPRSEKFALGGARNLRGFDIEGVGPFSPVTFSDGSIRQVNTRGLFSAFATIEFEHPLAREAGLKWVVFADAGHAGDIDQVKVFKDYGFGFRWFSPIGVLRFEFGYPLGDEGDGSQFHFDIGQLF